MPKVSRPTIYILVGALAVSAFVLTSPPPKSSTAKSPKLARKGESKVDDTFTAEDYSARFTRLTATPKNVFRPLVASGGFGSGAVQMPNAIPADFADGEPNWVYTGTAVVDGVPTALVENTTTQDGAFLHHGEKWKLATVAKITPTTLVLAGPGGRTHTMELMVDAPETLPGKLALSPMPVPASLTGAIEGGGRRSRGARGGATGTAGPTSITIPGAMAAPAPPPMVAPGGPGGGPGGPGGPGGGPGGMG